MKKIVSMFSLLILLVAPGSIFAQTSAHTTPSPSSGITDKQLKTKLLSIKKNQAKTKANLKINKAQVNKTLKRVKNARTLKKASIIKAKTKNSTITTPTTRKIDL